MVVMTPKAVLVEFLYIPIYPVSGPAVTAIHRWFTKISVFELFYIYSGCVLYFAIHNVFT